MSHNIAGGICVAIAMLLTVVALGFLTGWTSEERQALKDISPGDLLRDIPPDDLAMRRHRK